MEAELHRNMYGAAARGDIGYLTSRQDAHLSLANQQYGSSMLCEWWQLHLFSVRPAIAGEYAPSMNWKSGVVTTCTPAGW